MQRIIEIKKICIKEKEKLAIIAFAILVALFYGNTLLNGFVLDDIAVVVENTYIHSLRYLPKVVTGCIWEHALGECKGRTLHYRPIHSLSYLLTYQISSSPWFFHLVNLFYFLATVSLVFILVKTTTKNFTLSFFTAVLFLVHPINNEVVNWISAVSELTLTIFVLLTLLCYIKYRQSGSTGNFLLALLFYFFAILSKETAAIILFPVILSVDLLFFKKNIKEIFAWKRFTKYLLFAIPFLVYFSMRQAVIGGFGGLAHREAYFGGISFYDRIYYFFWLFAHYLKTLLCPYPLIFYHKVPESPDLLSLRFLISLIFVLLFFIVLYFAIKKRKEIIAFFLFWPFVFILPALILYFVVSENFFAERHLFVPSIGFSFMVAYLLNYLWQKNKISIPDFSVVPPRFTQTLLKFLKIPKAIVLTILISIIVASWLTIYPRNKLWKDNVTFLRADLALNPDASSIREYLAKVLKYQDDIEGAKLEYEEIIKRNPHWQYISHAYNNLGDYYREKGDLDKAQEYYEKAVQESEKIGNYKSYNNLGALFMEKQNYLNALIYFCQALQIAPDAPEPRYNFNRVASMITSVEEEDFIFLYMDVMDGEEFKKTAEEKIQYKRMFCSYDNCFYTFSPQLAEKETMLPFLIMAEAFPQEIVKIKNSSYNPESGEIILEVNEKYKDRVITFYFPTCDGIYYEVVARPKSKL